MTAPHAAAVTRVAAALAADLGGGLGDEEARARLAHHGPNRRGGGHGPRYLAIAGRQLAEPLGLLLAAAGAVSLAIGEPAEAIAIGVIVVLNALLGFVQEARAERAMRGLRERIGRRARVVRGGTERDIDAAAVVPGDLLVLAEGARVEADGRLVEEHGLAVDESVLTGESLPVEKAVDPVALDAAVGDRTCMVHADTWVIRGRGLALVTQTGSGTESGRAVVLAMETRPPTTPLQLRLRSLTRAAVAAGAVVTSVLMAGLLARGAAWDDAFLTGVAVAVAAVPEGLAATVTIALALGAHAMARRGAIVRRLAAVETLGETTVICTDKTGTLTENRLGVVTCLPGEGVSVAEVLTAALLASAVDARAVEGDVPPVDPLEAALLAAAVEQGIAVGPLLAQHALLAEVPFDPSRRRATRVFRTQDGVRVVAKGAPEALLHGPAGAGSRDLAELATVLAAQGVRVIAVAERLLPPQGDPFAALEHPLAPIGVIGLRDPLRPAVPAAVAEARGAGIAVIMVTGDHPATAISVGRALGLEEDAIRARVDPGQKLAIVEELQRRGEVVAVTGDGVNDAAALRRADVGVAMGRSGTEAAREAASVVLADDDFSTIVAAIREGRRIRDNLRKFVAFLLSANLGEVVLFTVAVLAGLGAPLTVVQVLVINVLTDGLPAVALSRDPIAPDAMRRGPERGAALFSRSSWVALGLVGASVGAVGLAAYLAGRATAGQPAGQTMAFCTVALAELGLVFTVRSRQRPAWREAWNGSLVLSVLASTALLGAMLFVRPLGEPLEVAALAAWQLGLAAVLGAIPAGLVEVVKGIARRHVRRRGAAASSPVAR